MGRIARHLRSNVVGYIALFFALGLGSAWAATELDKNEVKSKHIGKGQVKTKDLGKNSVTSPKVADGSLLGEDFAPGQLPTGPQGERGLQGEQGVPGEDGEDATNLFAFIRDFGDGDAASITYGSGVTGVSDAASTDHTYTVTFDRSLVNCAIHASSGIGNPVGGSAGTQFGVPIITSGVGVPDDQVEVNFESSQTSVNEVDTSFFITAFC